MTKPNYVTPAMVAAALHAVLLFGIQPDCPEVVISRPEPRPPKPPPVAVELPTPAPDPALTQMAEVKPLRGEPAPPDMAEPPPQLKPSDFPSDVDEIRPRFASLSNLKVPRIVGPVDGTTDGTYSPTNMPSVIGVGELDRMPRARVQVSPDYPLGLKQSGVEGSVLVEFDVDASGQVVSARVLHSERREFEAPTLRAVLKWRFEPGRRDGRAVPFRMQVPVDFHLNQD